MTLRSLLTVTILLGTLCDSQAWTPGIGSPSAADGLGVDTANRRDTLAFYQAMYKASENYAANMAWTGNVSTGVAGDTSAAFKNDVRRRINFYRAFVGQPGDITFNATKNVKDQKAALMFSVRPSYPFYDKRLVEFCLALPPEQKLRDGWSRFILRRASSHCLYH